MIFFSLLGIAPFYLLIMPALLWCYDKDLGIRIGLVLLVSYGLNSTLKLVVGSPRPYWISDRIRGLSSEPSYGLPSGHAQNAVAVWGRMAAWLREPWALAGAVVLMLIISFSRVYLGVHFPHDVLAGALIGAVLLIGFLTLERPIAQWLGERRLSTRLLLAFMGSALILIAGLVAWVRAQTFVIPATWHVTALAASGEAIDPLKIDDLFTASGTLFGLAAGAVLLYEWDGFNARGPLSQRLSRYGVGLIVLVFLYWGLGAFSLGESSLAALAWRYLRYALIGFWVTYGGPRLFERLGWVPPAEVN